MLPSAHTLSSNNVVKNDSVEISFHAGMFVCVIWPWSKNHMSLCLDGIRLPSGTL